MNDQNFKKLCLKVFYFVKFRKSTIFFIKSAKFFVFVLLTRRTIRLFVNKENPLVAQIYALSIFIYLHLSIKGHFFELWFGSVKSTPHNQTGYKEVFILIKLKKYIYIKYKSKPTITEIPLWE